MLWSGIHRIRKTILNVRLPWSFSGQWLERGIRRSEVRFLMGTQNFFFVWHARDKTEKKSFSSFYVYSHNAWDINDHSSMQDACLIWTYFPAYFQLSGVCILFSLMEKFKRIVSLTSTEGFYFQFPLTHPFIFARLYLLLYVTWY